jgi:hypothetical protein
MAENNLTKFGYIIDMKVEFFIFLKSLFLATFWKLSKDSGDLGKKLNLKIVEFGPFLPMKNPLENYNLHLSKGIFHGKNGPNFVDLEGKIYIIGFL